jgi:hypothetical protein
MSLRKSECKRKAITIWEEKEAPSAANDSIIPRKAARTEPETALKAIATGPLSEATKIDSTALPELPEYLLPLELHYKPSESISYRPIRASYVSTAVHTGSDGYHCQRDKQLR